MPPKTTPPQDAEKQRQEPQRKRPRNWNEAGKQMADHDPEAIARMLKEFLRGKE